jgi:hypothetical protein
MSFLHRSCGCDQFSSRKSNAPAPSFSGAVSYKSGISGSAVSEDFSSAAGQIGLPWLAASSCGRRTALPPAGAFPSRHDRLLDVCFLRDASHCILSRLRYGVLHCSAGYGENI